MTDRTPSAEQQHIISLIGTTNVEDVIRVRAVAGSGKTTTALLIAKAYPFKKILLLTYNRFLSDESAIRGAHMSNITFRTFHSFAGRFYGRSVYDDVMLIDCNQAGKIAPLTAYDIIIFDEFQDVTRPLFRFIMKVIGAYPSSRFIILGDPRQCIYQYAGATHQYMSLFGQLTGRNVIDAVLSTTYRVPSGIANFINHVLIRNKDDVDLVPVKDGPFPTYKAAGNVDSGVKYVVRFIDDVIRKGRYTADDIFILSASAKVKSLCPAARIANQLSDLGHLIFMSSEESSSDMDCIEGKIVISSFHKSKGRERKLVVVFGVDCDYIRCIKKDYLNFASSRTEAGRIVTPNEIYVACTRASHELVLVAVNAPAQFIRRRRLLYRTIGDEDEIRLHCTIDPTSDPCGSSRTSVTDLIAAMPGEIKSMIMKHTLDVTYGDGDDLRIMAYNSTKYKNISLNSKAIQQSGDKSYVEQVADINGVASTLEAARQVLLKPEIKSMFGKGLTPNNLLSTAISIQSSLRGHQYRHKQITSEDWLPRDTVIALGCRISSRLPVDRVEVPIVLLDWRCTSRPQYPCDVLSARIDMIYGNDIYEIKTTSEITSDHCIQVAVYRWMISMAGTRPTEDLSKYPVHRQLSAPGAYLHKDSRIRQEPSVAENILDDSMKRFTTRRKKKASLLVESNQSKMVSFVTKPRGRIRSIGYFKAEDIIVDVNGDEYCESEDMMDDYEEGTFVGVYYSPTVINNSAPLADDRTLVYNCKTDKFANVSIKNLQLFGDLIRMKAQHCTDEDFIAAEKV